MTKEEFKEKFKVDLGAKITHHGLDKNRFYEICFYEICFFGKHEFCVIDMENELTTFYYDEIKDWQHYKEPVKKDLEVLKKWYCVHYEDFDREIVSEVLITYVTSTQAESTNKKDVTYEYLTEEEAIERGLKI